MPFAYSTLFPAVKLALRITTTAFDTEIQDLILAAFDDLKVAGVVITTGTEQTDPLIIRAVTTYCKANFGEPDEYERLKVSYDEQKAQLVTCTGHTTWEVTSSGQV